MTGDMNNRRISLDHNPALKYYLSNARMKSASEKRAATISPHGFSSATEMTPANIYGSNKKHRKLIARMSAQKRNEKYRLVLSGKPSSSG
mmetsp:Transcript_10251/g.12794  ORF Transcript_10251/g.12794 Transcript_10251/m.12794 type:complete len:90 (-) Transcript_10251:822-1091(-)